MCHALLQQMVLLTISIEEMLNSFNSNDRRSIVIPFGPVTQPRPCNVSPCAVDATMQPATWRNQRCKRCRCEPLLRAAQKAVAMKVQFQPVCA